MDTQNAQPDIPLHCNLCPKKPQFSDVSHLLTHIASKGHLSNEFKTRVKAKNDALIQADVVQYDNWFQLYNVQDLMAERMRQKEAKGKSTANNSSNNVRRAGTVAPRPTPARNTPIPASTAVPVPRPRINALDPSLDRHARRAQYPAMPQAMGYAIEPHPNPFHYGYIPGLGSWSGSPFTDLSYVSTPAPRSPVPKQESVASYGSDNDAPYDVEPQYPTRRSTRKRASNFDDNILQSVEDCEMEETIVDGSKMKGVFWPGMAMFDSATPDMKRKRNQKKSYSVVQQLQATSETVTPTELVFDAAWIHRRTRIITGNPDDDVDHLEGESEPDTDQSAKKKVTRRPRQPLAERSVNSNGRETRRRPQASRAKMEHQTPHKTENDVDDDLTYQHSSKHRHPALTIYHDEGSPEFTSSDATRLSAASSLSQNPLRPSGPQSFERYQANPLAMGPSNAVMGYEQYATAGNFRLANDWSALLNTNLASFGHLNFAGQPMYAHNNMLGFPGFFHQGHHQSFAAGPQVFDHNLLHANPLAHWENEDNVDNSQEDTKASTSSVSTHHTTPDTGMSTLSAPFMPADDEGTISPPGSER